MAHLTERKNPIPLEWAEELVRVVFNADHEPYSTLEERFVKAMDVELGLNIDPPDKALYIARCILLRAGIEHVGGQTYQVPDDLGSVVSGPQWAVRLSRVLEPHEWDGLSAVVHAEWALDDGKLEVSRLEELLKDNFKNVEIVETIRKETNL